MISQDAPQPRKAKYRGVGYDPKARAWRARIFVDGRQLHVGRYETEELAAEAFDVVAAALRGKASNLGDARAAARLPAFLPTFSPGLRAILEARGVDVGAPAGGTGGPVRRRRARRTSPEPWLGTAAADAPSSQEQQQQKVRDQDGSLQQSSQQLKHQGDEQQQQQQDEMQGQEGYDQYQPPSNYPSHSQLQQQVQQQQQVGAVTPHWPAADAAPVPRASSSNNLQQLALQQQLLAVATMTMAPRPPATTLPEAPQLLLPQPLLLPQTGSGEVDGATLSAPACMWGASRPPLPPSRGAAPSVSTNDDISSTCWASAPNPASGGSFTSAPAPLGTTAAAVPVPAAHPAQLPAVAANAQRQPSGENRLESADLDTLLFVLSSADSITLNCPPL